MDLKKILAEVSEFVREKGDYVYNNWHNMTIDKLKDNGADVCTNFDKEVEKVFHDYVAVNYPDYGFRGEENPEYNKDGEYVWMIDPIDGTKFFAAGIPLWCLTLALVDKGGDGLLGVIYNPISKQLYSASKNNGAYLNGSKIELGKEADITKLQVSIDISATKLGELDFTDRCNTIVTRLENNFYRARLLGSGATSLAWLSQGFFGAFVDPVRPTAKLVDTAGGLCIAKEAGAEIVRSEIEPGVFQTIVAREKVVNRILEIID